jgi:hypothetical protein
MRDLERELRTIHGITDLTTVIGGGFAHAVNTGWGFMFQDNYCQRDVMIAVRQALSRHKDLRIGVRNAGGFNIGGSDWDIDLSFCGPALTQLGRLVEELRVRASQIPGVVDGDTTLRLDKPEHRVHIDRERAADLSVRTEEIARALRLGVGGDEEVSIFRDERTNQNYNVQLRLVDSDRDAVEALSQLYVPRSGGGPLVDSTAWWTSSPRSDRRASIASTNSASRRCERAWARGTASPIGSRLREPAAPAHDPALAAALKSARRRSLFEDLREAVRRPRVGSCRRASSELAPFLLNSAADEQPGELHAAWWESFVVAGIAMHVMHFGKRAGGRAKLPHSGCAP